MATTTEPTRELTVAATSFLHAAVFGWAAYILPLKLSTVVSLALWGMTLLHLATAFTAIQGSRALPSIRRVTSWASLVLLAVALFWVLDAGLYLRTLYGSLGEGVAAALLVSLSPLGLFTIPIALWGLGATGGVGRSGRTAALVVAGLGALVALRASGRASVDPVPILDERELRSAFGVLRDAPAVGFSGSLHSPTPASCEHAPGTAAARGRVTIVVSFLGRDSSSTGRRTECFQAAPERIAEEVSRRLRATAFAASAKVDQITGTAPLGVAPSVAEALALRPALDGACWGGSCLMPWQLVATSQFLQFQPFPFIPDLRFGISANRLGALLGRIEATGLEGLTRVVTESWVADASGELRRLERLRPPRRSLDSDALERAIDLARDYIVAAELETGAFRYVLDPYTGGQYVDDYVLPRQAGTTLALCQSLSPADPVPPAVAASLAAMAGWERRDGARSALVKPADATYAQLGDTALPLIAMLACREHLEPGPSRDAIDGLAARLGEWLMDLQRPDGGFYPGFDHESGRPDMGPDALYASGQAVYALSLLERRAASVSDPDAAKIREAVERAMTYFGEPYWDRALLRHFYLEENWHCLAASASLEHHRHDAYERFCIDYMNFKKRIVLDEDSRVASEFVGGHGFGNVLPPHNTPSAGLGETLAASIELKRARGEDVSGDRRLLRSILEFVVSRQWTEAACFACDARRLAVGSWSESMASPLVRIDFVQHALSAMVHGRRALSDDEVNPPPPAD